jgi:GntR family transcriptional regulator
MTLGKQHEKPVYVRLRETIADAILSGKFNDGDPLPSVRALAAEEQANPLTVDQEWPAIRERMDRLGIELSSLVQRESA